MADDGQEPQNGPGDGGQQPARPTPWSGRAGVPPPTRPQADGDTAAWVADDQPEGRWWLPIAIGVIALVLLGLLAVGFWLVMTNRSPEPEVPAPSPSPSATAEPTPTPTTAPPTTEAPTVAPSSAATVPMPAVVGLSLADAREVLDGLGIAYRLTSRESGGPAGTVVETDPPAGAPVDPGDEVTLVISSAPTATPTGPVPTISITILPDGWRWPSPAR